MQYRMPMEKCAAPAVLSGNPAIETLIDKAGIGHGLGEAPIHRDLVCGHPDAIGNNALHTTVQHITRRQIGEFFRELGNFSRTQGRIDLCVPVGIEIRTPIHREFIADHAKRRLRHGLAAIETITIAVLQCRNNGRIGNTGSHQAL